MTVNVALVTSEALILGCDSIASATRLYLDPLNFTDREQDGSFKADETGKWTARFSFENLTTVVTDAWGGVTKMFRLCADPNPVAAVTSGLAALNEQKISGFVKKFSEAQGSAGQFTTVSAVVNAFVEYIGDEYEKAHENVQDAFRSDLDFLIGGFGREDAFPSVYRVNLNRPKDKRLSSVYGPGQGFSGRTGLVWAGQADGVERLLFGVDSLLRRSVDAAAREYADSLYKSMSQSVVNILAATLAKLNATLPPDVDTALPAQPPFKVNWDEGQLSIDFANLPLQDAVDFVSYLVGLQSGKAKFVRGVPQVGGRTHIGIVQRGSFTMPNEPELSHRNIGYARDL
jgi:hypothetical protein